MATFTAFLSRIRPTPPMPNGEELAFYLACDIFVLDEFGTIVTMDGSQQEYSYLEGLQSLEPIELGDDQADYRRKASANIRPLYTNTILPEDTINVVWIDAL